MEIKTKKKINSTEQKIDQDSICSNIDEVGQESCQNVDRQKLQREENCEQEN